jgi:hypothetical protein
VKQPGRVGLFGLLLLLSTALIPGAFAQKPRGPQAEAVLACHDKPGISVQPAQYTLALIPRDLTDQAPGRSLDRPIAVFVRDESNSLLPIIQEQGHYFVLCLVNLYELINLADNPKTNVRITPFTTEVRAALEAARRSQETDLAHWGAIAFRADEHGADFVDWPAKYRMQIPGRGLLNTLVQQFERDGRTLLAGVTPAVRLTVMLPGQRSEDWPEKKGAAPANAVAQEPNGPAPSPLPGPARAMQPHAEQATQQPLPGPAPVRTVEPNGQSAAQQPPAAAVPNQPEPVRQQEKFTIGFQHQEWSNVRLEQDKADPMRLINTFGYCRDDTIMRDDRGLSYQLDCTPAEDGTIPVQIRGFQPLVVNRNEARQIDSKLEVVSFREPYPSSWNSSTTSLVEVRGGRLSEVLRASIELNQGVADTQACSESVRISIAEIVAQHITFPAPPCTRYSLTFAAGLTDQSAEVRENCIPGVRARRPIQDGRVVCWKKQTKTDLKLQVRAGFRPVTITVMPSDNDIHYEFANLDSALEPVPPYAGLSPFDDAVRRGEAPKYLPKLVEYGDSAGPCQKPIVISTLQAPLRMPSARDAQCTAVPTWVQITFAKDATPRDDPPAKAFNDSYQDKYEIRDFAPGSRVVDVGSVKRQLPILFNPERAADYAAQFQSQGGGVINSGGVYVFSGNGDKCGLPTAGKFVPFDDHGNDPQRFVWPQVAAVYGNRGAGHVKLTLCAPARLEENTAGEPYLTFDLDAVVANGPRRVIIIANNQALQHGISTQVRKALLDLIEELDKQHRQNRAPLSPISVYTMNDEGGLRSLFTGEDAVEHKGAAKSGLNDIDTIAPATPDFADLGLRQEVRENADSVLIVMDGSATGDQYSSAAANLARRFQDLGGLTFFIKADCGRWIHDIPYPNFHCERISQDQLSAAFVQLVNRRQTRADELVSPQPGGRR